MAAKAQLNFLFIESFLLSLNHDLEAIVDVYIVHLCSFVPFQASFRSMAVRETDGYANAETPTHGENLGGYYGFNFLNSNGQFLFLQESVKSSPLPAFRCVAVDKEDDTGHTNQNCS